MATERPRPISAIGLVRRGRSRSARGRWYHLEQYTAGHFSVVPTIGSLFLVNFVAATVLGLWLLIPVRGGYRPLRLAIDSAASLAGIGVAGGALVALLISEARPLFGFMEQGYRLEIVIALASEATALVLLGVFLALAVRRARELRHRLAPRRRRSGCLSGRSRPRRVRRSARSVRPGAGRVAVRVAVGVPADPGVPPHV